jgi:hypothetical protein
MTNQEFEELKAELKEIKSAQVGFGGIIIAVCIGALMMGTVGAIVGNMYVNYKTNQQKNSISKSVSDSSGSTISEGSIKYYRFCVDMAYADTAGISRGSDWIPFSETIEAESIEDAKSIAIKKHRGCRIDGVKEGACP